MTGSFELDEVDGVSRLTISGDIDLANEEAFCRALDRLAAATQGPTVLDLESCQYLDSSALRHIIHFSKTVTDRPVASVVNQNVGRIFEVVGMRRVLPYFYSLGDAISSMK